MPAPVEFYFDFSSPYGYLASCCIDERMAAVGREVSWRPYLLGAVYKIIGGQPLVDIPMKGEYARHDMVRSARRNGVPFTWPRPFPFVSVAAVRAFYWLEQQSPEDARRLAKEVFRRAFAEGQDVSGAAAVLAVTADLGLDKDGLAEALQDPSVKDLARAKVDAAIGAGVFGSPYFIVDGEPFWGNDRISDVEEWLRVGGW